MAGLASFGSPTTSTAEVARQTLAWAISLAGTPRAVVHLLAPDGTMRLVEHRGFGPAFLEHFASVGDHDGSACGRSHLSGDQVVISDVERDAEFEPHREIARQSDFRSVVSTPLLGPRGVVGVVSTHEPFPHRPSDTQLRQLRALGHDAGGALCRIDESGSPQPRTPQLLPSGARTPHPILPRIVQRFRASPQGEAGELIHDVAASLRPVAIALLLQAPDRQQLVVADARPFTGSPPPRHVTSAQRSECLRTGQPVSFAPEDLADDGQRSGDSNRAGAEQGAQAIAVVPVNFGAVTLGVLELHRLVRAWTAHELFVAQHLAARSTERLAAALILDAHLHHLQQALERRSRIEQAKGVISAQLGVDLNESFERLRAQARARQARIDEVAALALEPYDPP